MISEQSIPCPICQSSIRFDPIALVKGYKFSCPKCSAVVGIAQDALKTANDALEKYEALKKFSPSKSKNNSQPKLYDRN